MPARTRAGVSKGIIGTRVRARLLAGGIGLFLLLSRVVLGREFFGPDAVIKVAGAVFVFDFAQLVVPLAVAAHLNRPVSAHLVKPVPEHGPGGRHYHPVVAPGLVGRRNVLCGHILNYQTLKIGYGAINCGFHDWRRVFHA